MTNALEPFDRTIAAVFAAPSASMSTTAIAAPCHANSDAAAWPWPEAAPVISATLPSSMRASVPDHGNRRRRAEPLTVDVRVVALEDGGVEPQVRTTIEH